MNGFQEKPYHVNNQKTANQNFFLIQRLFWKQCHVLNQVYKNGNSFVAIC